MLFVPHCDVMYCVCILRLIKSSDDVFFLYFADSSYGSTTGIRMTSAVSHIFFGFAVSLKQNI